MSTKPKEEEIKQPQEEGVKTATAETEVATPEKTARMRWEAAIKAKNPDADFTNEDALYEAAMKGYDVEHDYRKRSEKSNKELADKLLNSDPNVATFISAILSGESFPYALGLMKDFIPQTEGDEGYDEYNKGIAANKARIDEQIAKAQEYEENVKKSAEALKEFAKDAEMSEEEAIKFVGDIRETLADKLFSGNIDVEFLKQMYNLMHYDSDMRLAHEAGRIEGRNESIDRKRSKAGMTDGLPNTNSNGKQRTEQDTDDPTLRALRGMRKNYERFHV